MTRERASILTALILGVLLAACGAASQAGDSSPIAESGTLNASTQSPPSDEPYIEPEWTSAFEGTIIPRLGDGLDRLYLAWLNDPAEVEKIRFSSGIVMEGDLVLVSLRLEDESFAESL